MTIEKRFCPLCALETENQLLRSHTDPVLGTKYDLFLCMVCDVEHWSPMQNPGNIWYERDERYANRNEDPILNANEKHTGTIAYINKIVPNEKRSSFKIFDIGCGVGNFLAYADKFKYDCTGIDFDRDGIEVGKRVFGLSKLYADDLNGYTSKHPEEKFDLVTFFDVFEHIEDHNSFTESVKTYLNPGGYIALSTPFRHGAHWLMPHDLPPRHLTRWDIQSQSAYFEKRGFTIVEAKKLPATIPFITMKLRWKYGKYFNFNLVGKIKKNEAKETYVNEQQKTVTIPRKSFKVSLIHTLAKAKDYIIFGIPATLIFIALLPFSCRYTDMYLIAKKNI